MHDLLRVWFTVGSRSRNARKFWRVTIVLVLRVRKLSVKSSATAFVSSHASSGYLCRIWLLMGCVRGLFLARIFWFFAWFSVVEMGWFLRDENSHAKWVGREVLLTFPLMWQHLCWKTVAKKGRFFRDKNCHAKVQPWTRFSRFFVSATLAKICGVHGPRGGAIAAFQARHDRLRNRMKSGRQRCRFNANCDVDVGKPRVLSRILCRALHEYACAFIAHFVASELGQRVLAFRWLFVYMVV